MPSREPLQPLHVQQVTFVSEQDGTSERQLKSRLSDLFDGTPIEQAFLARVDFGGPGGPEVALCIAGPAELPKELLEKIAGVYGAVFVGRDPMDVLLLSASQRKQIRKICQPFFPK
jgi:hypothetical protein